MTEQREKAAAEPPLDCKVVRLTRLQRALLTHIREMGGVHVYLSPCTVPPPGSALHGFTWAGVHLSLAALVRRGLIKPSGANRGFYTLTHNV